MKDNLCESLSVLMDNEGDELELRRVLKALDDSPDAAETWRRYHLARSLMRHDRDIDVTTDLSAGIMARIGSEPTPLTPQSESNRHSSLSFASGAAVAAAVSLMVITGVQFYNGSGGGPRSTDPETASNTLSSDNQVSGGALPVASSQSPSSRSGPSLPVFQAPAMGSGLMPVGIESELPMFMSPSQQQLQRADVEQARLLQSYLERHAEGAASASGEVWMPLLRASAQEPLSQR